MAVHICKRVVYPSAISSFQPVSKCGVLLIKRPREIHPSRCMWAMLNSVFNRVDNDRIKAVGPNKACAEWLLRCGASVKFAGFPKWNQDYNLLPTGPKEKHVIEEVDATDSCVMHIGFPHFAGCNHIKFIKLHHCTYLTDESLFQLSHLKESLIKLQVSSCGDISDRGLMELQMLQHLKHLYLYDLPEVKDINNVIQTLSKGLPECEIKYLSTDELEQLKHGKDAPIDGA